MGMGECRFDDCNEMGSKHYLVKLVDQNITINVPEMWKHYTVYHFVQPNEDERNVVMGANLDKIKVQTVQTRSSGDTLNVLYVEKKVLSTVIKLDVVLTQSLFEN